MLSFFLSLLEGSGRKNVYYFLRSPNFPQNAFGNRAFFVRIMENYSEMGQDRR